MGRIQAMDILSMWRDAMETLEAIRGRKSIRAFLSRPVAKEVIAQVLEASRWAPSGSNRQQWRVTVASGERCRTLADRLAERARERKPGLSGATGAPPEVQRRMNALRADLAQIAESLGQSRWEFVVLGSYRLYDAPVVVVVSHPGKRGNDVPHFVTTMLIAAHDLELGTCLLGYPVGYADLIREVLEIPEEERIAAVVALGYPDPDSPANAYRSARDGLESFVRWVGFE
jgi:nitroreductase